MITTLPRPRRQNLRVLPIPFMPTVAGYGLSWPSASPMEAPAEPLDATDTTNALLLDCLAQFEALNNADTFTRSLELRNRLRVALNMPLEVTKEMPEAPICSGCGAYMEDGCQCGNYPPDGWREEELLTYCHEECDRLQLPTLAERLADSIKDDRN